MGTKKGRQRYSRSNFPWDDEGDSKSVEHGGCTMSIMTKMIYVQGSRKEGLRKKKNQEHEDAMRVWLLRGTLLLTLLPQLQP
jgi:hypothetical protein